VREKFLLFLLPRIFKWTLILLACTCRVRWYNRENIDQLTQGNESCLISFWHENVLIIPWIMRNRGFAAMISDSRDGEYIARTALAFGNKVIRGSSSRGSTRATRSALRWLKQGNPLGITPDGPRGPAHQLQTGVLWLSALANCPIVPLHIEVNRQWRARSWDGQKLPRPFSTIHVSIGEPIQISKQQLEEDSPAVVARVQDQMMRNTNNARIKAGYPPLGG
jgi:lysophospholipid acyltransferase (LPLAT)-like uncharacterized protein